MDWGVIANLATALGTLVLAVATFLSIRSTNRSARTAERALQQGQRPVLLPSLFTDPMQKIHYGDDHWQRVPGGRGLLELSPTAAYLGLSVRDIGNGPAVIDGWDLRADPGDDRRDATEYYHLQRDVWVPAGECGYVQVAVRDTMSGEYQLLSRADRERSRFVVDVLYSDLEETQHYVLRLSLTPIQGDHGDHDGQPGSVWALNELRHWSVEDPVAEEQRSRLRSPGAPAARARRWGPAGR